MIAKNVHVNRIMPNKIKLRYSQYRRHITNLWRDVTLSPSCTRNCSTITCELRRTLLPVLYRYY